jgi:hypothetical protein
MSAIWKWYVYELVDPRSNTVFYVGKGTKDRILDHEREAKRGVCSEKTNKINEILASKNEVGKRKVAYFCDEQAAYDHETEVIASYGLDNLTNIMPGGQVAFNRRLGFLRQKIETPKPLSDWFVENEGKAEPVFSAFADWFRLGLHELDARVQITIKDEKYRFHAKLAESIYNGMIPTLWNAVQKCEKSMVAFAQRMKPYGIEVQYGRA